MTEDSSPRENPERTKRGGSARVAVWTLVGVSILLSLVGTVVLRLWILGAVVAVVALVVSIVGLRRGGSGLAGVLGSLAAVLLPAAIVAVTALGAATEPGAVISRDEHTVDLLVETEGDFTVSYTVPPAPGADKATVETVEATDRHTFSFTSRMNGIQFQAGILQTNLGDKDITCTVRVDGEVVLTRTSELRFVDCSLELQNY